MAVVDQSSMTKAQTDGKTPRKALSYVGARVDQTPVALPQSGNKFRSTIIPTPPTAAMTPDIEFHSPYMDPDIPKQLICMIQQDNFSSSSRSTLPVSWRDEDDSVLTETSTSPSQQHCLTSHYSASCTPKKSLFHLIEDCEKKSSSPNDDDVNDVVYSKPSEATSAIYPSNPTSTIDLRYCSDGPAAKSRIRSRQMSNLEYFNSDHHRRRNFARTRSVGEGKGLHHGSLRTLSGQVQTPLSVSAWDEDGQPLVRKNDSNAREARQSLSNHRSRSSIDKRGSLEMGERQRPVPKWKPRRINSMLWLICVIGMTSMATVVLFHSNDIDLKRMEQHDHIAVLFRNSPERNNGRSVSVRFSGLRTQSLPLQKDISKHTLQLPQSDSYRFADLHHLSQHSIQSKNSFFRTNEEDNASRDEMLERDSTDGEADSNSQHHHHHHKLDSNRRDYIRTKPGSIDPLFIASVTRPPPFSYVRKSHFKRVDRHLYTIHKTTSTNARVVVLNGSNWTRKYRRIHLYPADFTDNTQLYSHLDSSDEAVRGSMEMREPLVKNECVPMREWQTTFHPLCNGMHELDMQGLGDERMEDDIKLFGMKGFWRNAWQYDSIGGHSNIADRDTVVLKTLRINHRFEDAYYEHNRIDAIVLERLTASPHVINVFGFCGHSVVTEYADGKRLGELADKMKKVPQARLTIARDIASGLADVHGIDGDGNATFVHLDINPANVVSIGGALKLNDFNIGVLRRWNTTSNTPCGIPAQYPNPQWRSPEEARQQQNLTEKVDVFSLGHIFFRLICGHEPWHKLEPGGMPPKSMLNEKVKHGNLPTIPNEIMKSTDPEVVAIREAMLRCYTYDPSLRPSAREIAASLSTALHELESAERDN